MRKCETCEFFVDPGMCKRYPEEVKTQKTNWCGEFKESLDLRSIAEKLRHRARVDKLPVREAEIQEQAYKEWQNLRKK